MHQHGPNDLSGPIRGCSAWWRGTRGSAANATPADGTNATPAESPPPSVSDTEYGIRKELVERIRRQIAAGAYDTQEKWEAALDRLLDRMERDDL